MSFFKIFIRVNNFSTENLDPIKNDKKAIQVHLRSCRNYFDFLSSFPKIM